MALAVGCPIGSPYRAFWFLGAIIRVRAGGSATGGQLAILDHTGQRGFNSPLHRQGADEETFLIMDGELRLLSRAWAKRGNQTGDLRV